jgi:hypothetical protein
MTDHLDEAAARAVDLAGELLGPRRDLQAPLAAAHLTYMAGLLRGGVRPSSVLPGRCDATGEGWRGAPLVCHLNAGHADSHMHSDGTRWGEIPVKFYPASGGGPYEDYATSIQPPEKVADPADPRAAARSFRTSAEKVGGHVNPHGNTWAAGVRHGYLMAADALDEVADVHDQARAQRDELRRAIRDFLERVDPDQRDMRLHGALAQVEREIEAG